MSTSTPRLALTRPVKTEAMSLGDDILSDAYTKIDLNIGANRTRAAIVSPYKGQFAWDTADAQRPDGGLHVNDGASWRYIGGWHDPRGRTSPDSWVGRGDQVQDNLALKLFQMTSVMSGDRRYMVRYSSTLRQRFVGSTTKANFIVKWAAGTNVEIDGNLIDSALVPIYGNTNGCCITVMRAIAFDPGDLGFVSGDLTIGLFTDQTLSADFIVNPSGGLTDMDVQDIGANI